MEFAIEFAKTKVKVYAQRNQTDQKKIVMDCYYSKLAEFAAWKYLTDFMPNHPQYKPIGQPCIKVLERPNWDADLKNEKYKFAVKSVTKSMADYFGTSWTFNLRPPDKLLSISDANYKVMFVITHSENKFIIYGASHSQALKASGAYMFEDGVDLAKLKGIKLFVKADKVEDGVIRKIGQEILIP